MATKWRHRREEVLCWRRGNRVLRVDRGLPFPCGPPALTLHSLLASWSGPPLVPATADADAAPRSTDETATATWPVESDASMKDVFFLFGLDTRLGDPSCGAASRPKHLHHRKSGRL